MVGLIEIELQQRFRGFAQKVTALGMYYPFKDRDFCSELGM